MKKSNTLGRLSRVDLREVFTTEDGDFTPWLAEEQNLNLLGEAIGLSLQCEAQEKPVGPYSADILCRDTATDNWVLIENQIEKTDHSHLGQLITYAAGLGAVTIVWVAKQFTAEHRAALDWLNEHTDEGINFFALEIELWQIGGSPVAPKFNIVCQPNEWSRTVRAAAGEGGEISQIQLRFWTAFRDYMEKHSQIRCQKPSPQTWMSHAIGRSYFHLNSVISTWNSVTNSYNPEMRVELVLAGNRARMHFEALEQRHEEIEKAIGCELTWYGPAGNKQRKIYTRRDGDWLNETLWPEQHNWLRENLELFKKVFGPIVQALDVAFAEETSAARESHLS